MSSSTMNRVVLAVATVLAATTAYAITMDTVPVGNPGNAGELSGTGAGGYGPDAIVGAVDYDYNIGTYEVTSAQYVEFLNDVAATDPYGLYNTSMWSSSYGCKIQQSGTSGAYTYSVAADRANRPVNHVSWYDAARFSNWLTTGDTETGVYTFSGATTVTDILDHETAAQTLGKTAWFIPTEDEWYKAAYHKNDGVTGNYWGLPTATDSLPSNDLITPDPGNNANFANRGVGWSDFTIGSPYYTTEVGEFENSESPYGTFDQGGNLWEWNETFVAGSSRGLRGGYWNGPSYCLAASYNDYGNGPTIEFYGFGFRVASIPEPGSIGDLYATGRQINGPFDPHYTLISAPEGSGYGTETYIVSFPLPGDWDANTTKSKWIGPRAEMAGAECPEGEYVYRTTFDLTDIDPERYVFELTMNADNTGAVLLNGVDLGVEIAGADSAGTTWYTSYEDGTVALNLLPGVNTLDFVVHQEANGGSTGLRVEPYAYLLPNPLLPGDLNGDGVVGSRDLDIVRAHWNQTVSKGDISRGDPSCDGIVGSRDLDLVRSQWGMGLPSAVPEPGMVVLLIAGLGLLMVRRP